MSKFEFIGMLVICGSTLVAMIATITKPLIKNTETMTRLTATMENLIDRMDRQETALAEHEKQFEAYKEHMKESQKRQWDEIGKHHDKLEEHAYRLRHLEGGDTDV